MLQGRDNIILVSGHEHSLQYIEDRGLKQIVSGSASKIEAAKAVQPISFTAGIPGYATLELFDNGEVWLQFYDTSNTTETLLYQKKIMESSKAKFTDSLSTTASHVQASVYDKKDTRKSTLYKWLWGTHYRHLYGTSISAKTLKLDTIFGGLTPIISGGGNQSMSLRLENPEGKEYVIRALKKNATRFLQTALFEDQYVEDVFKNTSTEAFIYDFYTTSHPYAPFILDTLSASLGLYHTRPQLYYIPKQPALRQYNNQYGDALYMLEERPSKEHIDADNFGNPQDIISTDDMMDNLRKDEKYKVDTKAYLRARLFDMLIGDWDRHSDQWRWSEFEIGDTIVYRPIPRDRDQVFAKVDGALLSLLVKLPPLRHIKNYQEKFAPPRWINKTAFPLDLLILNKTTEKEWVTQATEITEVLTDDLFEFAFTKLPIEIQDSTVQDIKRIFAIRRQKLPSYAARYYKQLLKTVLISGTDKDDRFIIQRNFDGSTTVKTFRIKKSGDQLMFSQTYTNDNSKEIWIYGLDDDDIYEVSGPYNNHAKLRLLGGLNNDTYTIEDGKKVLIYDYVSKKNTLENASNARKLLSDNYEINEYFYKKVPISILSTLPSLGYNPDDGLKLGFVTTLTKQNFIQNPFSEQHKFKANYYFATKGFEIFYNAQFPFARNQWNLVLNAHATSSNFAINYFGPGNETINTDKDNGMDFNRVRMQIYSFSPALMRIGKYGSALNAGLSIESIEVEETENRFINQPGIVEPRLFSHQQFLGIDLGYTFQNYDEPAQPSTGMSFNIQGGWKFNLNNTKRQVPYVESSIAFTLPLTLTKKFVLATRLKGKKLFSNDYDFFQGASLGGTDLRGYRNERF